MAQHIIIKNSIGIEHHITDEYVNRFEKDKIKKMVQLRKAYNESLSGDKKALNWLLSEVHIAGMDEDK